MELISYEKLGRLRLRQFLPEGQVRELTDWEFLDDDWVGEAVGFTEVLRLAETPDVVSFVALHLSELPDAVSRALLAVLGLSLLRKGMHLEEISAVLGAPTATHRFQTATDRVTYEFEVGRRWPYTVECTVQDKNGLTFVSVKAPRRVDG